MLEHPTDCEFPAGVCTARALRFCGCTPSGYTFDAERGWWVHYHCGWPTRAWYERAGRAAPDELLGVRPVTLHEFVGVPRGPRGKADPLTPGQRALNDAQIGAWVRD